MAIADTIQSMYDNVGEVYDTITNVDLPTNKNIQNIPSTMRSSYLEIMNNGIDKIWNNWEKVTGEGETLTLNSTEEAPMKINLKGNTSQFSTTGKNLLPNNQTTQTINGVTFTMNSDKSVTIKGTATANTDYYFVGTSSQYEDFGLTTGTYNFNGCTGGSEQTYMLFAVLNRNGNMYYNGSTTDSGRRMIVETGDTFRIFIRVISGTTVNKTIYPQINVGSTPLSYEPYTNGASPNPDYPQDIHVVSGDNSIEVCGKNLFNVENGTRAYGGQTYSIEDNIFKFSSTTVSGSVSAGVMTPYTSYSFDTSSSYVWSLNKKSGNWTKGSAYPRVLIYIKYSDNTTSYSQINLNTDNQESASNTITFTSGKIPVSFAFGIYAPNGSLSNNVSAEYYVQLEKGNQATTYEAYKSASYPINLGTMELCKIGYYQDSIKKSTGKNLFDKSTITTSAYLKEDGTLQTGTGAEYVTSDFIPVKPNTTYYKTLTLSPRTKFYDANKQVLDNTTYQDVSIGGNAGSFTTPSNAYYFRFTGNVNTSTGININTTMINEGGNSIPYEPYGKVWYLNKQIGKVVFDGSESWTINTSYTYNVFYRTLDNYARISNAQTTYCEYYKGIENAGGIADFGNNYNNSIGVRTANDNIKDIYISNNSITSASDFKIWLSTHNTVVYYVLSTPTYTEITDSTLISQLDTIKRSFNGQTNITQTNNDKPFILDVTALKQLTQ